MLLESQQYVRREGDYTAHAELRLLSQACKNYDRTLLSKCTIFSSTEPCAMCAGAIFWSNIRHLVYGMPGSQITEFMDNPQDGEGLNVSACGIFGQGSYQIKIDGPILLKEAREVHSGFWSS